MFQAMLCDDNEIILEGLSRQIDWEGLGICLSGTAADGQDAWNQMKDNPPDILITDIRMPYIDGLELSRLAKDLNPNIVLLIISAYDDFEYARTAMHLRALDYILKPIDLDAMNRILTNAVSHCRQFHHDKRLMATQLLRNMAVQEAAGPEGIVLNELDLEPDSWCCFLQVELDDHSLSKLSDDIRYASERRFSALSQILFGDSSYLLESHQYSYSVCLTSRSRMELAARRKILVDTIRRQFPHEGSYCDVSIASGSIVQGIRLLHKSVQTCHEAGKLHFIKGSNADIFYEEVESYIYNEPEDSQGYPIPDTRLITFIKEQNKDYRRAGAIKNMALSEGKRELSVYDIFPGKLLYPSDEGIGGIRNQPSGYISESHRRIQKSGSRWYTGVQHRKPEAEPVQNLRQHTHQQKPLRKAHRPGHPVHPEPLYVLLLFH